MTKFIIRDDDVNYFTHPQDLEKIYCDVWDKCPISTAVIPFIDATAAPMVPKQYCYSAKEYPIGENKELIYFLQKKIKEHKIIIMLHGYNHRDNNTYEFADETKNEDYYYDKIKKGKDYLEDLLGVEIKVFVPPHNTISKNAIKAVIKAKLNLAVMPSFYFNKRPWNLNTLKVFIRRKLFKLINKTEPPYVLDFSTHKEINCYPLTPLVSFEFLKEKFDIASKYNGIFCLATHYWEFNAEMVYNSKISVNDVFRNFWEYVNSFKDIKFISFNQII